MGCAESTEAADTRGSRGGSEARRFYVDVIDAPLGVPDATGAAGVSTSPSAFPSFENDSDDALEQAVFKHAWERSATDGHIAAEPRRQSLAELHLQAVAAARAHGIDNDPDQFPAPAPPATRLTEARGVCEGWIKEHAYKVPRRESVSFVPTSPLVLPHTLPGGGASGSTEDGAGGCRSRSQSPRRSRRVSFATAMERDFGIPCGSPAQSNQFLLPPMRS